MLKEGNQRGADRCQLTWRDVDVVNQCCVNFNNVTAEACEYLLVCKGLVGVQWNICTTDNLARLSCGVEVLDLAGDFAVGDLVVRGFDETEGVDACVRS